MDNIAAKALALVNGVKIERGRNSYSHYTRLNRAAFDGHEALCRAIEQHEAFRQEVSDAIVIYSPENRNPALGRFIITEPNPLVEVLHEVDTGPEWDSPEDYCNKIRAALEARGLEIREKGQ